jgi:predicted transcriptional regulator
MNEILTHRLFRDDIADGILELVEQNPGITTGEIEKAIDLSDAGTRYRLLSLEAAQLIRRERIRGRVHYYLNE